MATKKLKATFEFCADSEKEIDNIIKDALFDGGELTKKVIEAKQKKKRGELLAERYKVTFSIEYDTLWADIDEFLIAEGY